MVYIFERKGERMETNKDALFTIYIYIYIYSEKILKSEKGKHSM